MNKLLQCEVLISFIDQIIRKVFKFAAFFPQRSERFFRVFFLLFSFSDCLIKLRHGLFCRSGRRIAERNKTDGADCLLDF